MNASFNFPEANPSQAQEAQIKPSPCLFLRLLRPRRPFVRCPLLAGLLSMIAVVLTGCGDLLDNINRTAYFGWGGYASTTLKFSEFFQADHTITAWFMLQHPEAYAGPILTIDGSGTFFVGQGDYLEKIVIDGQTNRGYKLVVQIGSAKQLYFFNPESPENSSQIGGTWHHLAVRRMTTFDSSVVFSLVLDGKILSPSIPINVADGQLPAGSATLRFGRQTAGKKYRDYDAQYYGFVDDVAVFQESLSTAEIKALISARRLTGEEAGLYSGFTFDKALSDGSPLPSVLKKHTVTFGSTIAGSGSAGRTMAGLHRDGKLDAKFLPLPFQQVAMKLPFQPGQAWYVGWGNGANSHLGYACFCWDFTASSTTWTDGCGQPLYASAPGTALAWVDDGGDGLGDCDGDDEKDDDMKDGPDWLRVQHAPGEACIYMHTKIGSIAEALKGVSAPAAITAGQWVARVGTRCSNNCHLHTGVSDPDAKVTIPVAYSDYQASDDGGETWYSVKLGVPRRGQWVRNPCNLCGDLAGNPVDEAHVQFPGSATAQARFVPPARGQAGTLEIQPFALNASNLHYHISLPGLSQFPLRLRGGLTVPRVGVRVTAPVVLTVESDGQVRIPTLPLAIEGSMQFDLPGFGRVTRVLSGSIPDGSVPWQGALRMPEATGKDLELTISAATDIGPTKLVFRGAVGSLGQVTLALDAQRSHVISSLVDGGRGDIDRDGDVDAVDFSRFSSAFTGALTEAATPALYRLRARAASRVGLDPSLAPPHPESRAAWDVQLMNDGITARSNYGNNPGNFDTWNGANEVEADEWFALLAGPQELLSDGDDLDVVPRVELEEVDFTEFRYWRGPQFADGGWWAGPVVVEVMTAGDPYSSRDVLEPRNWRVVANSEGSMGTMRVGPFLSTPEPNDDPWWDARLKVHRETGDPEVGRYVFSDRGDADDSRPLANHWADDGDRNPYVARPDYLHFRFPATRGRGIRIRGRSANGPEGGTGTFVSCAEIQAWFNPTNASPGFTRLVGDSREGEAFDFDGDGDIDMSDYGRFMESYDGAPRIHRIELTGVTVRIHFHALARRRYALQTRSELTRGGWSTIHTFESSAFPAAAVIEAAAAPQRGFFRLLLVP